MKNNPDISLFQESENKIEKKEVSEKSPKKEQTVNAAREDQISPKISQQNIPEDNEKEETSLEKKQNIKSPKKE